MKIWKTNIVLVTAFVFLLTGCTNLEETLYSELTAEETDFTEDDLDFIIAPAYSLMRDMYWGWEGLFDIYEESSDLIVTPARVNIGWGQQYVLMHQHTWNSSISHSGVLWFRTYQSINNINRAILQLEQLPNAEGVENYIAEMRGLRALCYYLLYDNFRNVPIVTRFDVPEGFLPEQEGSQAVYDFIINELTEIMPLLDSTTGNNPETYGRFTQWGAKMTLAKMYLNSEVYIGTPRWQDAIDQVQDVIDNGGFGMASEYSDVFAIENQTLPETIFSIPFDRQEGAGGSYLAYKTLYAPSKETFDLSISPWGGSAAIPQFIDTYDEDDKRLTDTWLGGPQFDKSGQPLLIDPSNPNSQLDYLNLITSVTEAYDTEGYRYQRYEIGPDLQGTNDNDVPFFRLTDAYMIKAECLLRTGRADEAASIVSMVRERAFRNTNPAKATVTGAELQQGSTYNYGIQDRGIMITEEGGDDIPFGRFLDELAWEFVGEHHRRQDLIRFGVYTTKSWLSHVPNGDYRTIFPIPQFAIEANPNLEQNPGY